MVKKIVAKPMADNRTQYFIEDLVLNMADEAVNRYYPNPLMFTLPKTPVGKSTEDAKETCSKTLSMPKLPSLIESALTDLKQDMASAGKLEIKILEFLIPVSDPCFFLVERQPRRRGSASSMEKDSKDDGSKIAKASDEKKSDIFASSAIRKFYRRHPREVRHVAAKMTGSKGKFVFRPKSEPDYLTDLAEVEVLELKKLDTVNCSCTIYSACSTIDLDPNFERLNHPEGNRTIIE